MPFETERKNPEVHVDLPEIPGMTAKEFVNYKNMTLDISAIWLIAKLNCETQHQFLGMSWLCTLAGLAGTLATPSLIGKAVTFSVGLGCAIATGLGHKKMSLHQESAEKATQLLRRLKYGKDIPHSYYDIYKLDWVKKQIQTKNYQIFSRNWDHYTQVGYRLWKKQERLTRWQRDE